MPTEGQVDLAHPEAADWVLGTLEPAESEEFQRHLTSCGHCQLAVAEFGHIGRILQHLPPAVEPPLDLEARTIASVLAAAANDRTETQAATEPGAPARATQISLAPPELASLYRASPDTRRQLVPVVGHDEPAVAEHDEPAGATAKVTRSPRWRRHLGRYAIAGAIVAAIVAAIVFLLGHSGSTSADAPFVISLHSTSGRAASGRATARDLPGGWSIQLSVNGLTQLAPGEFYECWFAGAGNKPGHPILISAGTFSIGRSGSAKVSMWSAADPRQFRTIEITAGSAADARQHGRVILSGVART
jgi:hypothetical protein